MRKLIINSNTKRENLTAVKEAGWDGVFLQGSPEDLKNGRKTADELGLIVQSIHAPFTKVHYFWERDDEEAMPKLQEQIECIEAAASIGVDLVVMHAIIGMERCTPTQLGIERFGKIFEAARKNGVRIALENTEGEIYLETLLNAFANDNNVGFCIDTGHEMCYNYSKDLIGKYGHRLFSTHLNDNMGITGEKITWLDDAHVLPFDGIADWQGIANRLNKAGYRDMLTFELTQFNRPDRHTSDAYEKMTYAEFVKEAHNRAVRFAELVGE